MEMDGMADPRQRRNSGRDLIHTKPGIMGCLDGRGNDVFYCLVYADAEGIGSPGGAFAKHLVRLIHDDGLSLGSPAIDSHEVAFRTKARRRIQIQTRST